MTSRVQSQQQKSPHRLTVLFILAQGHGPRHACVGVAQQLVRRGHRVIFAQEPSITLRRSSTQFDGIEEVEVRHNNHHNKNSTQNGSCNKSSVVLFDLKKLSTDPLQALKSDFNNDNNHDNDDVKSSSSRSMIRDYEWHQVQSMLNIDYQLGHVISEVSPDVIVVNSPSIVPCVHHSYVPWVWLWNSTPLACLPSQHVPPSGSGYPTSGSRNSWNEYREAEQTLREPLYKRLHEILTTKFKVPRPPVDARIHASPYLNIYAYPKEVDYLDHRPLLPNWLRFDHFVRMESNQRPFEIPLKLQTNLGKLIYVTLGSLGSSNLDLVKHLISTLSQTPNRFIISLGSSASHLDSLIECHSNVWGGEFLPQISILDQVDLVICHGGTMTVLESLYHGRSMIITPLYGEHFDNAQRIEELELGARLLPYETPPGEFCEAIERLTKDEELARRLSDISKRMKLSKATEKAAIEVEKLAVPI